jgi:uncharacterized protein (TIGR02600 family)
MNPPKNHQPRVPGNRNPPSGAALILVLASLIFVSVLTVAFLSSMRSKLVLAKSGAEAGQVRLLAGTAVNIAISQVRDATKKSGQENLAWASQPGMVRLYDDKGAAAGYYKLYSAEDMVVTSGAFDPAAAAVPPGWAADPAVFTDLNEPSGGVFPILDFAAASGLGVQGFSLAAVPGATTNQPAPMPVKWLYVLQDGSLHAAGTGSSGTKAVIPAATAANPIVGRIAFWADDETCKVNVNTASDGTFWATPRFNTTGDRKLASSQPARGEFQRYPGHPATVSLRSVFPSLTPEEVFAIAPRLSWGGSKGGTVPVQNVTTNIQTDRDRLYDSVDEVFFGIPSGGDRGMQAGLSLTNTRAARFFLTASSRAPELNLFGLPRILSWPIHAINDNNHRTVNDRLLAFCATLGGPPPAATFPFYFTRQRNVLPEFDINLPRNVALLNYLDRLTARPVPGFGGSLQDASKYGRTETRQILTQVFDYIRCANLLDQTTPQSPAGRYPHAFGLSSHGTLALGSLDHGAGRSLGTAAPAYRADWGTRGFGGRFLQVFAAHLHFVGVGRGESGTTPADYKPPVPVHDNNTVTPGATNNHSNYQGPPRALARQHGARQWNDLYPDLASITNALAKGGTNSLGQPKFPYNAIPYNFVGNNIPPPDTTAIQAFFYLTTLTPGEGTEQWSPGHWVEFDGLDQFAVKLKPSDPGYTPLGFPAKAEMTIQGNFLGGGRISGARVAAAELRGFITAQNRPKFLSSSPEGDYRRRFTAFSAILPVDANSPAMAFKGGKVRIRIFADAQRGTTTPPGSAARGALVSEYDLTFPDATFPMPRLAGNRLVGAPDPIDRDTGTPLLQHLNSQLAAERWALADFLEPNNDVLRSVALADGDIRLLLGPATGDSLFKELPDYFNSAVRMVPAAYTLKPPNSKQNERPVLDPAKNGRLVADADHGLGQPRPWVPEHINGVTTSSGAPGDWDNGTSIIPDGPFINAPDAGSVRQATNTTLPYYDHSFVSASSVFDFFSPNRQMPGPGMFGSLSTGVQRRLPWQTLLFRPGPPGHPGSVGPADHLLLDLFWMPIVEPYAISEPFSTAGKINMNQQLVPFTYINRMVGLRAALAAEQVAMVAKSQASGYKLTHNDSELRPGKPLDESRKPLNLSETDGTLRQFREKFAKGEIFRSATEICDIYLVPEGKQWGSDAAAQSAWYGDDFAMVGDNVRERPYTHLHNKLTTKSNVFTVHYRAQALQKSRAAGASAPTVFDTGAGDRVAAEERGATTFERYLDPNDPRIVDPDEIPPGGDPARKDAPSLEKFYRARIVNTSVFNP